MESERRDVCGRLQARLGCSTKQNKPKPKTKPKTKPKPKPKPKQTKQTQTNTQNERRIEISTRLRWTFVILYRGCLEIAGRFEAANCNRNPTDSSSCRPASVAVVSATSAQRDLLILWRLSAYDETTKRDEENRFAPFSSFEQF